MEFFANYCLIKTYFQLISSVIKQGNYFPLFKNPSLSSQLKYSSAPLSNEWLLFSLTFGLTLKSLKSVSTT